MADQKYRVIKRLQSGGMAEVYVGEATSLQGFKKRVAIKRVLPHLAQNENFIGMFLDEARLSAKLNHANIVSVFDISAHDDTYFLIMEFVEGANLKQIMEALGRRGQRFSLGEAVYITIEAARGLSYAHELADENGTQLGIVHRDVSPPNIMVTKRGEVKVADFGLAKAGTQLSTTDPGVVKGKFSYLSPEAAQGVEVDARTDIFSLGIVLWEMLAGKRLFLGENDYSTVKLIQKANIPRLAPLNRQVDEQFEEVLLKALTRDPKHRFQSAREFGDALAGYLFNRQLKVTSYDIANLVTGATSEESSSPNNDMSLIDRLIQEELDESVGLQGEAKTSDSGTGRISAPGSMELTGDLEDPASWFADSDPPAAASRGTNDEDSGEHPSGSWRESGLVGLDGSKAKPGGATKPGASGDPKKAGSKAPLPPAPRRKDSPAAANPAEPVSLREPVRPRPDDAPAAPPARPAAASATKAKPKAVPQPPAAEAAAAPQPPVAAAVAPSAGGAGKYLAIGLVVAAVIGAAAFWFTTRM
jgi:serine/threonine protein kinase